MAVSRINLSQEKVSQKVNLEELLGRVPTPTERNAFIEAAKELIIERTQSNSDINGRSFKDYTENYARIKGVSQGSVDLTLFGDMLLSIKGASTADKIDLFIDGDEAKKAYGHMTGFKGHPTIPQGRYKRRFFGLKEDEAANIAEAIKEFDNVSDLRGETNLDTILARLGIEIE
jgi:hypothetical protein